MGEENKGKSLREAYLDGITFVGAISEHCEIESFRIIVYPKCITIKVKTTCEICGNEIEVLKNFAKEMGYELELQEIGVENGKLYMEIDLRVQQ